MTSLANLPPITHAVTQWNSGTCEADGCYNIVDVVFGSDDPPCVTHCPACMVRAAGDEEERQRLIAILNRIRTEHSRLGLANMDDLSLFIRRHLLGPEMITGFSPLIMSLWYPSPRRRGMKMRNGPNDPYVEEYALVGTIAHDPGSAPDPEAFSQFPTFRLAPLDDTRTNAIIYLTAILRDPTIPGVEIVHRVSHLDPTTPPKPRLDGWPDPDQYKQLWNTRDDFSRELPALGRRRGSGRFTSADHFKSAVFAAVATLCEKKQRATQDKIGRILIAKRGRNATATWHAGESHGGPDRQFRIWCAAFGFDPQELVAQAIADCANEE